MTPSTTTPQSRIRETSLFIRPLIMPRRPWPAIQAAAQHGCEGSGILAEHSGKSKKSATDIIRLRHRQGQSRLPGQPRANQRRMIGSRLSTLDWLKPVSE